MRYFSEWLDDRSKCPSGKLHWKEIYYNDVKDEVNKLGLLWEYSYPDRNSYWNFLSEKHHRKFDQEYQIHKDLIKEQYNDVVNQVITF